jgi:hypothetical protein
MQVLLVEEGISQHALTQRCAQLLICVYIRRLAREEFCDG